MPAIHSKLNPRSAEFRANSVALSAAVADLRDKFHDIGQGGGEAARVKHTGRGKLLPRERVRKTHPGGSLRCDRTARRSGVDHRRTHRT